MTGQWARVTPDELARALDDPRWADALGSRLEDTDRHLTTHKAWQAIGFLLERAGFPVDIVLSEEPFPASIS